MSALAQVDQAASDLPALVDHASQLLANARCAAEVLQAKEMAGFVYDQAKRAARLASAQKAHIELLNAVREAQGDAAEIEFEATARLAEEYSLAQERGEAAKAGKPNNVPDRNDKPATAADLGISRKTIHEGRLVRDAEEAQPGIVRRSVDDLVQRGLEPSKAAISRSIAEAAGRAARPAPKPEAGEAFSRFVALAADLGKLNPKDIISGIPAEKDRANLKGHVRSLLAMLEDLDGLTEGDDHA